MQYSDDANNAVQGGGYVYEYDYFENKTEFYVTPRPFDMYIWDKYAVDYGPAAGCEIICGLFEADGITPYPETHFKLDVAP